MYSPLKRSKHSRSPRAIADLPPTFPTRQEHGERNEAREPKDRRDRLYAQNGELVVRNGVGEAPWHDDEVDEREERPDGGENEEVYGRGGAGVVPV